MNNEEKILAMLEKHDAMFEKQAALLDKLTSDMAEMKTDMAEMKTTQTAQGEQLAAQGEQLAALGEQLAAQGERLLNIEMRIENTIIPDIKALAGGHMQLLETLASKESVEDLKDSMVEWETANKASLSEMWRRLASLERAN